MGGKNQYREDITNIDYTLRKQNWEESVKTSYSITLWFFSVDINRININNHLLSCQIIIGINIGSLLWSCYYAKHFIDFS